MLGALVLGAPADDARSMSVMRSVLVAFVVEAALLAGSSALILNASAKVDTPQVRPVEIVIEEPAIKAPQPEPLKPVPKVEPKVEPKVVVKVKPVAPQPQIAQAPSPPAPVTPPAPEQAQPVASPIAQAPPAPAPVPPPQPRNNEDAAREADFAARARAAIQATVIYPAAARSMGHAGRVRVAFHLRDGVTSQINVLQSSGISMLDRAAMAAVANAAYPAAPDSLKGKDRPYQVTVTFDLNSTQ